MLKYLFVLILTFSSFARTTVEQIKINKPMISDAYALRLAKVIKLKSDKYKIPANVITAIMRVESSYILSAVNKRSNDYGIMQINNYNIRAYKFDKDKLLTDLDYSIDAGCQVFKWFYRTYKDLDHAIQAYNGGTAKDVHEWKSTKDYLKKIKKFM